MCSPLSTLGLLREQYVITTNLQLLCDTYSALEQSAATKEVGELALNLFCTSFELKNLCWELSIQLFKKYWCHGVDNYNYSKQKYCTGIIGITIQGSNEPSVADSWWLDFKAHYLQPSFSRQVHPAHSLRITGIVRLNILHSWMTHFRNSFHERKCFVREDYGKTSNSWVFTKYMIYY